VKLKKTTTGEPPALTFVQNPDILASIATAGPRRPKLVIGFAAETHELAHYAEEKRRRKNTDWIVANDVSPATGIMGGADNEVHLITADGIEHWPRLSKQEVAVRLAQRIAAAFA
jgi:phosphopantothenoylcysteine decarboxylase / phosphopantothenate---cysteine ligase